MFETNVSASVDERSAQNLERLLRAAYPTVPASAALRERVAGLERARPSRGQALWTPGRVWLTASAFATLALLMLVWTTLSPGYAQVLVRAIAAMSRPVTVHCFVTHWQEQIGAAEPRRTEQWQTRDGRFWQKDRGFILTCPDGVNIWSYDSSGKVADRWTKSSMALPAFGPQVLVERMRQVLQGEPLMVRAERARLDGKKVWKIIAIWGPTQPAGVRLCYVWYFDLSYLLVREDRWEEVRDSGWQHIWTRDGFEYEVPIPDDLLALRPPQVAKDGSRPAPDGGR